MIGRDTYISGDDMISVFRFENGQMDFWMRSAMTDRLKADRAARRWLFGLYRDPYTAGSRVRRINITLPFIEPSNFRPAPPRARIAHSLVLMLFFEN